MTGIEYEQWWQLHLRVATGETLGVEEERLYQAGLELLDREEATQICGTDVTLLRSLCERTQTLVQLQNSLLLQSDKLDERIEELERTYQLAIGGGAKSTFTS